MKAGNAPTLLIKKNEDGYKATAYNIIVSILLKENIICSKTQLQLLSSTLEEFLKASGNNSPSTYMAFAHGMIRYALENKFIKFSSLKTSPSNSNLVS